MDMRMTGVRVKWLIFLACFFLLSGGILSFAYADGALPFKDYNAVMKYVRENHPMDLDIGTLRLRPSDLAKLADALPEGAELHFATQWCGTVVSDTDEVIDLNGGKTTVQVSDLETLIRLCPNLKKIILSSHKDLSNKQMIPIVEKYPEIDFVWKVSLSNAYKVSSDATAFTTNKSEKEGYMLHSEDMYALKYVKNLKALDIGHCAITSLDFLRGLDLELLILSHNNITDISVLAEMPHLQYLELFRNNITDISPLAACTELIDLNIAITKVTDLTPLDACPKLERLWLCTYLQTTIPDEANKEHFRLTHPDCILADQLVHPTGDGWRTHPRYDFYRENLLNRVWIPFSEMEHKNRVIPVVYPKNNQS